MSALGNKNKGVVRLSRLFCNLQTKTNPSTWFDFAHHRLLRTSRLCPCPAMARRSRHGGACRSRVAETSALMHFLYWRAILWLREQ